MSRIRSRSVPEAEIQNKGARSHSVPDIGGQSEQNWGGLYLSLTLGYRERGATLSLRLGCSEQGWQPGAEHCTKEQAVESSVILHFMKPEVE